MAGIRQQLPYDLWVGYHPGITQDYQARVTLTRIVASAKRRSPYTGRGVRPGQIFVTLAATLPL